VDAYERWDAVQEKQQQTIRAVPDRGSGRGARRR